MHKNKKPKAKIKLKYSMSGMIIICWLIPLLLFTYVLLVLVSGRMKAQITNTIVTSSDKAIEICLIQMEDVITSSRNASYMTDIRDSYSEFLITGSEQDLYNGVNSFLTRQYKYNPNILCTMVFFNDEPSKIYYTVGYGNTANMGYLHVREFQEYYEEIMKEELEHNETGVVLCSVDGHLYMLRNMVDSDFKTYGVIAMELNADSIFESIHSVWGAGGFHVYLDDEKLLSAGEMPDFQYDIPEQFLENSIYTHKGEESYVYKALRRGTHKIGFVIGMNPQAMVDELEMVRSMLLLLIIFFFPLILIIFLFLYKNVTKPIGSLVQGAKEITQGNYGHQLADNSGSWEFDYLEGSFNAMSRELKHQFEQIYLEELELKEAEIMALQSQINPHFLNNTLEIINWECRMTGNTKTSSMIEALSIMLNATMNRKKQNMIPLSEELSYVDAYLLIIQQRFGTRFRVTKNIDHGILWVEVPRLIIQPIIENAVEHGMDAKNRGMVTLNIYQEGEKVHIDVTNNGKMSEADRRKIEYLLGPDFERSDEKAESLGIRNVNRRLKIIYGEDCGLTITSNEDGFTVSRIVIDMNYNRQEERDAVEEKS